MRRLDRPDINSHATDVLFGFVMEGTMTIEGGGRDSQDLAGGDAFAIPPGVRTRSTDRSPDLELLEVSLPAAVGRQSMKTGDTMKMQAAHA